MLSTVLMRNQLRCLQQSIRLGSPLLAGPQSTEHKQPSTALSLLPAARPFLCAHKIQGASNLGFSTSPIALGGTSGNHVNLWTAERAVAVLNFPAIAVPFLYTTPMTDAIFCTLVVLHFHWGIEAIVVDYVRPSLFGGKTLIPNLAQAAVWAMSAFTLGGLYYFNYTDVGIVNAIKMLWTV